MYQTGTHVGVWTMSDFKNKFFSQYMMLCLLGDRESGFGGERTSQDLFLSLDCPMEIPEFIYQGLVGTVTLHNGLGGGIWTGEPPSS